MNRRDLLTAGATIALASAATSTISEAAEPHHHHHGGGGSAFLTASYECLRAADACLQHCLILLGDGDTSMKRCAVTVNQMRAVCHAAALVVAADSKHVKILAAACAQVCEDCEEACRVHEKKHKECKDCANACAATVVEAKKLM